MRRPALLLAAVVALVIHSTFAQEGLDNWPAAFRANGTIQIQSLRIDRAKAEYIYNSQVSPFGIAIKTAACPTNPSQRCTVFYLNKMLYILQETGSCCFVGTYTPWPLMQGYVPPSWTTLTQFQRLRKIDDRDFPEYMLKSDPPVYYYPNPSATPRSRAPPAILAMNVPSILGRSVVFNFIEDAQHNTYYPLSSEDFALFANTLKICQYSSMCQ